MCFAKILDNGLVQQRILGLEPKVADFSDQDSCCKSGRHVMDSIFDRLVVVFRDVFDDDDLEVTRETSAADVENWDSLMHVSLIIAVEKAFGVRFSSSEVAGLQNVGELADLIQAKGAR